MESAGHSATRLVDDTALKRRLVTFTAETTNAFHVDETQEVFVQPPTKFFDQ